MMRNTFFLALGLFTALLLITPAWAVEDTAPPFPAQQGDDSSGMTTQRMQGRHGMMHGQDGNMPCPMMEQGKGKKGQGMGMMQGMKGGNKPCGGMGKGMMHGGNKPCSKMGKGMGMMHGGKGGNMPCPMMQKGMKGKGMMQGQKGMHKGRKMGMGGLMRPFHRWTRQLMAHQQDIGLSESQINQLDKMVTDHLKNAVRQKAEIKAQRMELKYILRNEPIDLQTSQDLLRSISTIQTDMQVEGLQLYNQVLQVFTPEQKEQIDNMIGSPFAPPWKKKGGSMMMDDGAGDADEETDEDMDEEETIPAT